MIPRERQYHRFISMSSIAILQGTVQQATIKLTWRDIDSSPLIALEFYCNSVKINVSADQAISPGRETSHGSLHHRGLAAACQ